MLAGLFVGFSFPSWTQRDVDLIDVRYRLYRFRDIVRAIRVGDVRLFTSELEKHAEAFIQVDLRELLQA